MGAGISGPLSKDAPDHSRGFMVSALEMEDILREIVLREVVWHGRDPLADDRVPGRVECRDSRPKSAADKLRRPAR
jgi:hypothetical protein